VTPANAGDPYNGRKTVVGCIVFVLVLANV